jgi:hypothetical protein
MPGHLLNAICACGFERRLFPGSGLVGDRLVGRTIAYSADESDLLTEEASIRGDFVPLKIRFWFIMNQDGARKNSNTSTSERGSWPKAPTSVRDARR